MKYIEQCVKQLRAYREFLPVFLENELFEKADKELEELRAIQVQAPVSPKVADNDISNWEVYHSNSSDTGMCYNHPRAGDESVMIRNKVTNKFSFLQLNK